MKNQFYSSTITMFLNYKLNYKLMFLHVLSGLLNNCKKCFFCWLKQLLKYYKRLYALIYKLHTVKMSDW